MKNHWMQLATATALAAGMALAQTPAPAPPQAGQGRPGMMGHGMMARGMGRGMMRQRLMQALNLTDAQKQQAKAIFQEARQNAQPLAQQLKDNRTALAAAVKANDTAQIQSLSVQQGTLRGQMLAIHSEAMAKFYGTLTPDQKAKADQLQQKIRQRMEQRFGNQNG